MQRKPRTKEELLKVRGFGAIKVDKYWKEIIGVLKSGL